MRLPYSVRSKVNDRIGRAPLDWKERDWEQVKGEWRSGPYRIMTDPKHGLVIAEVKNIFL